MSYVASNYVSLGYFVADGQNPKIMVGTIIKSVAEGLGIPVTYLMGDHYYFNEVVDNASSDSDTAETDTVIFLNNNYRVKNSINARNNIEKQYPIILGFFKQLPEFDTEPAVMEVIVDEMETLADRFIKNLLIHEDVKNDRSTDGDTYEFVPTYWPTDRHLVGGYLEFNLRAVKCVPLTTA